MDSLNAEIQHLKSKMLVAVQNDLDARAFEVAGSGTAMISALAELLIFFSLGDKERRSELSNDEREWWNGFCASLVAAAK